MFKKSIIILLSLFALSCGNKKEKENSDSEVTIEVVSTELKQEIESIEAVTEELKKAEESIEASIKKLDDMLNKIEN
ncbi:hypothetical protein L3X37_04310 [Sabulilitoribacter arenilitoris]|uniref:Lipoprotein n=1 Tax=Wocania arenilitoris TaxID=2044858 RepID=A0AAE3EME9_9FLAO|nr:hypothetical protein [Wocania arenilitoris]MCF7567588.1 hypothetical protein [Wocania arenilitoris]